MYIYIYLYIVITDVRDFVIWIFSLLVAWVRGDKRSVKRGTNQRYEKKLFQKEQRRQCSHSAVYPFLSAFTATESEQRE